MSALSRDFEETRKWTFKTRLIKRHQLVGNWSNLKGFMPSCDKPSRRRFINYFLLFFRLQSVIMLMFREEKSPEDEIKAWQFWHSRQHSVKQRILDAGKCSSLPRELRKRNWRRFMTLRRWLVVNVIILTTPFLAVSLFVTPNPESAP